MASGGASSGRTATVMVSNTSASAQTAQVYLDVQGQRQTLSTPLSFIPYETKVLDITQLLTSLGVDPAQAPEGGITIVQSGGTPSLVAAGRITDPTSGFSSTIHFPSPDLEVTSVLHATGVPVGTPSNDSPFVGAGTFTPHVVVRNLSATAQTVTVTLEYPQPPSDTGPAPAPLDPVAAQDGTHSPATVQSLVTTTTMPAYTTQDISLAAAMSQFPTALSFAAVRIQYSGAPGSLEAEVPSVESTGSMVVDSIVQNEGNGWAGSGANPWHLDQDTESILFLTNASDQPAHIGFSVTASGSPTYYLTKLLLNPHETRAIDIRKLRDAQKPDFRKNLIPAGSTDGSINWVRGENLPVVGRVMQINRKAGLASNYDCGQCSCPYNYTPSLNYLTPQSQDIPVEGTGGFLFYAGYADCNNNDYYYNYATSASWSSGNSSIASSLGYGLFSGVSAGSASVSASYTDSDYTFQGSHCSPYPVLGGASATVTVADDTPEITGISNIYWLVGATTPGVIISGYHFRTSPIVNFSDHTVTCTQTQTGDTQITCNITVPSSSQGGTVGVTVTSQGYNASGFIGFPGGSGGTSAPPFNGDEQKPGFVNVGLTTTGSEQCGTSSFYADTLQVYYQVYDTTPSPILVANMQAAEILSWQSTTCATSDGCQSKPTPATWQTDSNGKFMDTILNCSQSCINNTPCTEAWQQTFKVNGTPVGIINKTTQGTMWCITTSCSSSPQGILH